MTPDIDAPKTMKLAEALDAALAHHKAGRFDAAQELYTTILKAQPAEFNALHLLGALFRQRGNPAHAIRMISEALAISPGFAPAYFNLAMALLDNGQIDDAMRAARTALTLDPTDVNASRALLHGLLYVPDVGPEERFAWHLDFASRHQPASEAILPPPQNDRSPDRRLRVGLLSSDLWDHPVGRNLLPFLLHYDHAAIEVLCYAAGGRADGVQELIRRSTAGWRSVAEMNDRAIAEAIRADGVDVLVVLAARFDGNRPLVACYRPAPVQVSMFDCATTALSGLDYWVTDPVLNPPGTTERFTEQLVRLPLLISCRAIDDAPPVTPPPAASQGHITFGSFNNPAKVTDQVIALWARVLRAVPASRLLLKYRLRYADPALCARLRIAFGAQGVDPARLSFLAGADRQREHLSAYGGVDVALDTTPFTGSTTTFDALWMGVPVITLAGDTMVSRTSASLLTAAGLADFVASSPDAFVERAVALAGDPSRLSARRAGLRDQVLGSRLCDGPAYARSMESLCRALWREWCAAPR